MFKNPTPRQIALQTALFITLFFYLSLAFTTLLFSEQHVGLRMVVLGVFNLAFAYLVIIFYLKKYIYRKIKVIYKNIHKHKLSPEEKKEFVDIDSNIIEAVEKEVEEWSETQNLQIQKYKTWADYRRKFVGDISHELKTPIFNIQGYVHTLLDGAIYDEKNNLSFLKKAAKNLERLHTIVEDLAAISRLESGELVLEMQTFDIKELAEEVFEELEIKAKDKKISLEFKDGAYDGFKVVADQESIRQVLINLVNNSIKYGQKNGHTKLGFYDMDKYILVEVADNGIGIPKEHINHVFDRFYRVDKSRSRAQGGSGLGLAIVKHIIEAHKQTINVRSATGLGSTFGFTLEKA